jgi:sodium pump decarboxylase gamma subunit
MLEDLLVCIIGLAVVFVVLAVLMFMIIGMGRLSGGGEEGGEGEDAGVKTKPDKAEPGSTMAEDTAELAVVALAMASYLRQSRRELGPYITIDKMEYQVDIGDIYSPPIPVVINGEKFWASLNCEGLPVPTQPEFKTISWPRDTKHGSGWRSAYPASRGGYWSRGGWTGRRAEAMDRK